MGEYYEEYIYIIDGYEFLILFIINLFIKNNIILTLETQQNPPIINEDIVKAKKRLCYEITKFVEQKVYPTSWGPEELDKVPHIKPIVAKYFMQITKLDLPNVYRSIDFSYRDTFWEIIDVFDVRGVIDENSLRDSFNETWELRELLHRERLVNKNGILLRKLLMSNPHNNITQLPFSLFL